VIDALATLGDYIVPMLGNTVTVWAPNKSANAAYGIDDPAWVSTGTATAIINELTPQQAEYLVGGPVNTKLATLYIGATDGAALTIGCLVVTSDNRVWRVDGEPSQPAAGGHYEARLAFDPSPPAEVLGT